MTEPKPSKRRRRWFSLSLRSLMLLILVLGGLMGWKARRASLQRRAVARIEMLGGTANYDWQDETNPAFASATEPNGPKWLRKMLGDEYFQEVTWVALPDSSRSQNILEPFEGPHTGPEWEAFSEKVKQLQMTKDALARDDLACLEGLDRIEMLFLHGPPLKTEGLDRLCHLTKLKQLSVAASLTDEGLPYVARLPELQELKVRFKLSEVSSLSALARLPKLKKLDIVEYWPVEGSSDGSVVEQSPFHDQAKDSWLRYLGKLKHLTELSFYWGTEITDEGLKHLTELHQLEILALPRSTHITDAGLGQLKQLIQLQILELAAASEITDAGLNHLKQLTELQRLNLMSASKITDEGLASLIPLKKLEQLYLGSASNISDAGVGHLVELKESYYSRPGIRIGDHRSVCGPSRTYAGSLYPYIKCEKPDR